MGNVRNTINDKQMEVDKKRVEAELDTDDDYDLSEDSMDDSVRNENSRRIHYSSTIADYAEYLSNSLTQALDSVELDKSLALQTRISGQINNENQKVLSKKKELILKLNNLKELFDKSFVAKYDNDLKRNINKVDKLKLTITDIEERIEKLKKGEQSNFKLFDFYTQKDIGVAKKYPVEYNQSKDKVFERLVEDPSSS